MRKTICLAVSLVVLVASPMVLSASQPSGSLPVIGVVQHLVVPPDRSKTFFSVIVGRGFSGMLPGGIDEIVIEGPDGVCPLSRKDFKYVSGNREFWATLSGPPEKGDYKITITAGDAVGVVSATLADIHKLPMPKSLKCDADKDGSVRTNRPVFAWETDRGEGRLYYQLQLKDSSGKSIYKSDFLLNSNVHRPLENVLGPGRDYFWRVRVFDCPDWLSSRNRSQTNWVSLKTAGSLEYDYSPPETTDDGWETGHIETPGVEPAPLKSMLESIINNRVRNIHGLLLVKDGKLVLEEYFEGYGREDLHLVASVTKSVNSILFGQAMDMGLIKNLDQSAWDFFPEYDNPVDIEAKRKIKLRHLLTMTAGLDWDYLSLPLESPEYPTRRMMTSGDPVGFILGRKAAAPPGRIYNYNDGLALMLGEIIHRVSDMPVGEFAETRLFGPLGIKNYAWERTENGITETHGGLYLRPRDMGKIGRLVLQDGQWNGKRIVSSQWLRASTGEHVKGDGKGYGYQWRMAKAVRGGRILDIVWASGYGGQRIFIAPDINAVAVITSKVLYHPAGGIQAERLFVSHILPALLPEDESSTLPAYSQTHPERIVGCYEDDRGFVSGCVVLEGTGLHLVIKARNLEEKCELKPISESELIGHSARLGEFRIVLNWADNGELDHAVFNNGLRSMVLKKVDPS